MEETGITALTASSPETTCEMCANYEIQLQTLQAEQDTLREQLAAAKELYEKYGNELTEERNYRKELEGTFATLNEEIEGKLQCLVNVDSFEERIVLLGKKQEADLAICIEELELAKNRQKDLQNQLITLNDRYLKLSRANTQCAEEMREQHIELPQTLEELQFLSLQLREELINERAAREHEISELRDELTIAREQLLEMEIRDKDNEELLLRVQMQQKQHQEQIQEKKNRKNSAANNNKRERASASTSNFEFSRIDSPSALDCCSNHRLLVTNLEARLSQMMNRNARLEEMLTECKQRCSQMQNELDTSEMVQKDFVRLSQQLQIELEKIRQSEIEVRWQEPDDVNQCNECNKPFISISQDNQKSSNHDLSDTRTNCRHCGKIFCSDCLTHKVLSGPTRRPVPVCNLCHTLLSKEHSLVGKLKPAD